jgi:hypothetical protein
MNSEEEVAKNLSARLAAEQVASLADEEAVVHGKRFWHQLAKIVCAHVPAPKDQFRSVHVEPMNDVEVLRFGKQLMPFGEFQGKRIDEVPLERLCWYADQKFVDQIRRYLASERIVREREMEQ